VTSCAPTCPPVRRLPGLLVTAQDEAPAASTLSAGTSRLVRHGRAVPTSSVAVMRSDLPAIVASRAWLSAVERDAGGGAHAAAAPCCAVVTPACVTWQQALPAVQLSIAAGGLRSGGDRAPGVQRLLNLLRGWPGPRRAQGPLQLRVTQTTTTKSCGGAVRCSRQQCCGVGVPTANLTLTLPL